MNSLNKKQTLINSGAMVRDHILTNFLYNTFNHKLFYKLQDKHQENKSRSNTNWELSNRKNTENIKENDLENESTMKNSEHEPSNKGDKSEDSIQFTKKDKNEIIEEANKILKERSKN